MTDEMMNLRSLASGFDKRAQCCGLSLPTLTQGASAWFSTTLTIRRWHGPGRVAGCFGTPPTVTSVSATRVILRPRRARYRLTCGPSLGYHRPKEGVF